MIIERQEFEDWLNSLDPDQLLGPCPLYTYVAFRVGVENYNYHEVEIGLMPIWGQKFTFRMDYNVRKDAAAATALEAITLLNRCAIF